MPAQIKQLCAFRPNHKIVLLAKKHEAMMALTYREHLAVVAGTNAETGSHGKSKRPVKI